MTLLIGGSVSLHVRLISESCPTCRPKCSMPAKFSPSGHNVHVEDTALLRREQHFQVLSRWGCRASYRSVLAPPKQSSRRIWKRLSSFQEQFVIRSAYQVLQATGTTIAAILVPQCLAKGCITSRDCLECRRIGGLGFSRGSRMRGFLQCSPRLRCSLRDASDCSSGSSGHSAKEVVASMRSLLEGEPSDATKAAADLVSSMDQQGRAALLSALFSCGPDHCSADLQFKEADTNADGVLDKEEFANYVEAQEIRHCLSSKPLTANQILNLGVRAAIGMIGFGFVDNAVMIIAGDAIENSIGSTFGLSTLTSAGLGNTASDLLGTAFCGYIEGAAAPFMPELTVSNVQMTFKEAWWAETVGSSIGITIGCFLGLLPLVFIKDSDSDSGSRPYPTSPRSPTMVSDKVAKTRAESSRSIGKRSGSVQLEDWKWCSTSIGRFEAISPFAETAPSSFQRMHLTQRGQTFVLVMLTIVMALKRLAERGKHPRRKHHGSKDAEKL